MVAFKAESSHVHAFIQVFDLEELLSLVWNIYARYSYVTALHVESTNICIVTEAV